MGVGGETLLTAGMGLEADGMRLGDAGVGLEAAVVGLEAAGVGLEAAGEELKAVGAGLGVAGGHRRCGMGWSSPQGTGCLLWVEAGCWRAQSR